MRRRTSPSGQKTKQPVAVKFDLMQPFLSFGRRIDQRGKLHARILLLQGGQRLLLRAQVGALRGFRLGLRLGVRGFSPEAMASIERPVVTL